MIDMKEVNKKHRCIPEMDENGIIKHDGDKIDPDNAMIFCLGGKGSICKYNDSTFIAYVQSSNIFGKLVGTGKTNRGGQLKTEGVKVESYLLDGEGEFKFNEKDLDKVCKLMKAKTQGKNVVKITNFKGNRNYYTRLMKNIDPHYATELKNSDGWQ